MRLCDHWSLSLCDPCLSRVRLLSLTLSRTAPLHPVSLWGLNQSFSAVSLRGQLMCVSSSLFRFLLLSMGMHYNLLPTGNFSQVCVPSIGHCQAEHAQFLAVIPFSWYSESHRTYSTRISRFPAYWKPVGALFPQSSLQIQTPAQALS